MKTFFHNNKGGSKISPVGIGFIIIGIFIVLFGAFVTIYGFQEVTKNLTTILIIANIILVCATAASLYYAGKSNTRAERLFVGENRPLIDVTPIAINQNAAGNQAMTLFSISNYSGFKAYNICIDLRYGKNGTWILEWRKAEEERKKKGSVKGIVKEKFYDSQPMMSIRELDELGPGETIKRDEQGKNIGIIGGLNLEQSVCTEGQKGFEVRIRVTWQNENKHVFDAVHQYKLICTSVGEGRAFTFIPQGIVSQKDIVNEGSRSEQKPMDS